MQKDSKVVDRSNARCEQQSTDGQAFGPIDKALSDRMAVEEYFADLIHREMRRKGESEASIKETLDEHYEICRVERESKGYKKIAATKWRLQANEIFAKIHRAKKERELNRNNKPRASNSRIPQCSECGITMVDRKLPDVHDDTLRCLDCERNISKEEIAIASLAINNGDLHGQRRIVKYVAAMFE